MKFTKILLLLIGLVSTNQLFCQESLPFYQQYLISDKVLINPSFTGSTDDWVFKGTFNKHWGNFDGGPNTQTLSTHVNLIDRVGVGMYFFRDENGAATLNGVNISAAYHIPIGDEEDRENQFSFGPSLSLFNQSICRACLKPDDPNDVSLADENLNVFLPYLNLGVNAKFKGIFGGVSVLDIPLGNNREIVNTKEPLPTWYYFNLGYNWNFAENLYLEPSVLMNINTNSERQLDGNLKAKYKDDDNAFAVGVSYRQDLDENGSQALMFSPLIQAELGRLNFGFAYTLGLSNISRQGGNGFVISLGYNVENILNTRGFRYR